METIKVPEPPFKLCCMQGLQIVWNRVVLEYETAESGQAKESRGEKDISETCADPFSLREKNTV